MYGCDLYGETKQPHPIVLDGFSRWSNNFPKGRKSKRSKKKSLLSLGTEGFVEYLSFKNKNCQNGGGIDKTGRTGLEPATFSVTS